MLCPTLGVGVCIVFCCTPSVGVYDVCKVYVHVLHFVVCHVGLYAWDVNYVYVYMVKEKELDVFRGGNSSGVHIE